MIFAIDELESGTEIDCDICIVGAGVAGITIAQALAGSRLRVVILESGDMEPTQDTEIKTTLWEKVYANANSDLTDQVIAGNPSALKDATVRRFGGTSSVWIGQCRPLKKDIFADRPSLGIKGWPISYEDLKPWYANAGLVCDLPPFTPEMSGVNCTFGDGIAQVERNIFLYSPPTRFGNKFFNALKESDNIRVMLRAILTEIKLDPGGTAVSELSVKTLTGKVYSVKAKSFVLSMGGLENARALLLSNKQQTSGVGNSSGTVGRYFMEHPHALWDLQLNFADPSESQAFAEFSKQGFVRQFISSLSLSREDRDRFGLLDVSCLVSPKEIEAGGSYRLPRAYSRAVNNLESNEIGRQGCFYLPMMCEQEPQKESGIYRTDLLDPLGMVKFKLKWKFSRLDMWSMEKTKEIFARYFGSLTSGRVWLRNSRPNHTWGGHHMGMTRMSAYPQLGVVDQNCRSHDIRNLYIAGSSVFPTSGSENPTLTIVALALRLARHLIMAT